MTAQHYVDVELDEDGRLSFARFTCTGSRTDICQQWCAEGCEEYCTGGVPRLWPHDDELIAQAPVEGHRWEPRSSCNVVDWLDAVGAQDTYTEEGEPHRAGRHLIADEWDGDSYYWSYAEDIAAVSDAGVPL